MSTTMDCYFGNELEYIRIANCLYKRLQRECWVGVTCSPAFGCSYCIIMPSSVMVECLSFCLFNSVFLDLVNLFISQFNFNWIALLNKLRIRKIKVLLLVWDVRNVLALWNKNMCIGLCKAEKGGFGFANTEGSKIILSFLPRWSLDSWISTAYWWWKFEQVRQQFEQLRQLSTSWTIILFFTKTSTASIGMQIQIKSLQQYKQKRLPNIYRYFLILLLKVFQLIERESLRYILI